jgi:Asp-tRNA(Asn)/Glu-tRNA(Gln) amidotransferase A subunit family amidase
VSYSVPRRSKKPHNRFTLDVGPSPWFKTIPTVLGPIARSVEDIELASRVVFGKSANHSSAPVLYREVNLERKLKFGYYFDDGMARTTPVCRRAVTETIEALRKQGHECVEFELPSRKYLDCLFLMCFGPLTPHSWESV